MIRPQFAGRSELNDLVGAPVHFVTPKRAECPKCVCAKDKDIKTEPLHLKGLVNNTSKGNACRMVEPSARFIAGTLGSIRATGFFLFCFSLKLPSSSTCSPLK